MSLSLRKISAVVVSLISIFVGGSVGAQEISPLVVETPVWGQSKSYSDASEGVGVGAYGSANYDGAWDGSELVNPVITNTGGSYYNSLTTTGGGESPLVVTGTNPVGSSFSNSYSFIGVGEEGTLPLVFIEGKSVSSGSIVAPEGYDPLKNYSTSSGDYTGSYTAPDGVPTINIGVSGFAQTSVTGGGKAEAYNNQTNYFQSAPIGTPNPK